MQLDFGGSGEIRTHGRVSPSSVFKTDGLNHSPTLPKICATYSVLRKSFPQ